MKKIFALLLLPVQLFAQKSSFASFKHYPFTTQLCASRKGSVIAWACDEEGKRNVYIAEGADFKPRRLTNFSNDDGQEITSLTISDNGKWIVFVRGGDHDANYNGNLPVNSSSYINPLKTQILSVSVVSGKIKYLTEGDEPAISPDCKEIAFLKDGQVWVVPVDGSTPSKALFTTRGDMGALKWSSDGRRLAFVADRGDHSIVGIYTKGASRLTWISPSFYKDDLPDWSPDGSKIVFQRRPGGGGVPDSMLVERHSPWSIYVADTSGSDARLLWEAPKTLRGSVPSTDGGINLHWAADNQVVFLSYHDGWPHLYSINADGGNETLLTPGNFMCEHIVLSTDKKLVAFSANTGDDPADIERRHICKVTVGKPDLQVITSGNGSEWTPVFTGDGKSLFFISATVKRPPLPAVIKLDRNADKKFLVLAANLVPADFPAQQFIAPKQVIFKSADGVEIHADLFQPPGGVTKKPAIIYLHGGPQRQMLLGWHYFDYYSNAYACNQYLASLGFIVLSVNYRLGIGYGYEFHHPENGGPYGASEYQDVKAAGLWLQQQSFVDGQKIGLYGGSYGGYLTAMALAKDSKLFRAGVDISGVHNWVDQYGLLSAYNGKYEKAPDYQQALQIAWSSSPLKYVDTWTSPVLVIQADDDRNVSFNQSVDLISRLENKGVPFESIMIADDTHNWMSYHNAVKVYSAVADFFSRKLLMK